LARLSEKGSIHPRFLRILKSFFSSAKPLDSIASRNHHYFFERKRKMSRHTTTSKPRRSSDPSPAAAAGGSSGQRCNFCRQLDTASDGFYAEQHPNYVSPCVYCWACLRGYLAALNGTMLPCRNYASCGGCLRLDTLEAYVSRKRAEEPPTPTRTTTSASSSPTRLSPQRFSRSTPNLPQASMLPIPYAGDYVLLPLYVRREHLGQDKQTLPAVAMFPSFTSSSSPPSSQEMAGSEDTTTTPMETTHTGAPTLIPRPVLLNLVTTDHRFLLSPRIV
jgi:hypothetical protein